MDCILASYTKIVTQHRVIDISLPDHQLIYCTKKISGIKRGSQEKIKFCPIVINYSKKLKSQNYILIKISIMQQDINYKKWF